MTQTLDSFAKAANPASEIGANLCIRLGKATIKLDVALPKDAPSTKEFLAAAAVLETQEAARDRISFSKAAKPDSEFGIDLRIRAPGAPKKLDIAVSKDAPATQRFMDTVAVLIGLKEIAQ
jgi:hypothetical protein